MSGSAIVTTLLHAATALTGMPPSVPTARIQSGTLPEKTALPAIAITVISGFDRNIVSTPTSVRVSERVQVTVMAKRYPEMKQIMLKVRKALRDKRSCAGFTGVNVTTDGQGADDFGNELGFYMQTQDFLVTFDETT
jgi:hypothetical protein